jgi:hypothetical protein
MTTKLCTIALSIMLFLSVPGKVNSQYLPEDLGIVSGINSQTEEPGSLSGIVFHVPFGDLYGLFEKIYLIDLVFNLGYVEGDFNAITSQGVEVLLPAGFDVAQFENDLHLIIQNVKWAASNWDKNEQGLFMAGVSEKRVFDVMSYVMGRDDANDSCHKSFPFCTGTNYNFPAGVNSGSGQQGPAYGCLITRPNPAWYHLLVGTPGNIIITMQSNPLVDIDFICWGPFDHPVEPCVAQLTSNKIVSCSYSIAAIEVCTIPNAQTGQYYILLITNFSNQPCNISFSQTGGSGTTDCTIVPPPIGNNGPLCTGQNLQLYVQNPIVGSTYAWSGPNNWTSTQQNPVIPNVNLSHAGDYTLIITLFGQTSNPVTTTVEVYPAPNPFVVGPQASCQSSTVGYSAQNAQPGSSFEWIVTGGDVINGQGTPNASVFWNNPGLGTVRVAENSVHCNPVFSPVFNVNVSPLPGTPSKPVGPDEICTDETSSTYLTTSTPNTNSYIWSLLPAGAGLINGNGVTAEVNWEPGFSGTASVFVQGLNDCGQGNTSDVHYVTVSEAAIANAGEDFSIPHGSNTILHGSASGGNQPFNFSWSPPDLLIDPYVAEPLTVNLTETTIFTLTVDDAFCFDSDQVVVTVTGGALGVSVGASPSELCLGQSCELSAFPGGGSGNYTFSWTSDPPGFLSTAQFPEVFPTTTTIYTVEVNDGFNTSAESLTVIVFPVQSVYAGDDQDIANGTSTTLNAIVTGGTPPYSFSWQPADKLIDASIINPQTVNLFEATVFSLVVTDVNSCVSDIESVSVFVSGNVLTANPAANPSMICLGFSTQLFANPTGGSMEYSYEWTSDPPGFFSSLENPFVSPLESTTYFISLNDGFNIAAADVFVELADNPVAAFYADIACHGTPSLLTSQSTIGSGSINSLIWRFNNAEIGFSTELDFIFPDYGDNTVTLFAISDKGCIHDTTIIIRVDPLPQVDLVRRVPSDLLNLSSNGDTIFMCVYNSITLDAGNPDNPNQVFEWNIGSDADSLQVGALGVGYELQRYEVIVTDTITGCSKSEAIFVEFSIGVCESSVSSFNFAAKIDVWPNPAHNHLMVNCTGCYDQTRLLFFNVFGQLVMEEIVNAENSSARVLDISHLRQGVYFLRFDNFSYTQTVKLVVSK